MLENRLKRNIKNALVKEYPSGVWYIIHGGPQQERGIPDIIGCYLGKFITFEVKRPGKDYREPTEYQKLQLKKIDHSGGKSTVVTSVNEALSYMSKIFF